jgi:hypothetical protein
MDNFNNILWAGLFIYSIMHVDQRSAKIFAGHPKTFPLVVNRPLGWVDAEKGLNFAPSEVSSGTSNPTQDC